MERLSLTHFVRACVFCVTALAGCLDMTAPPGPTRTPAIPSSPSPLPPNAGQFGAVAGFVVDETDGCIIGARVEVVEGLKAGASFVQKGCNPWDYSGNEGYMFDLPPGLHVILRATAEGYKPVELRVWPTNPYAYTTTIRLTKQQ